MDYYEKHKMKKNYDRLVTEYNRCKTKGDQTKLRNCIFMNDEYTPSIYSQIMKDLQRISDKELSTKYSHLLDNILSSVFESKNKLNGKDDEKKIDSDEFKFIFFGCWGVYCEDYDFVKKAKVKDGIVIKKEKTKKYEGKQSCNFLFKHAKNLDKDAVVIAGDNIYGDHKDNLDIHRQLKVFNDRYLTELNSPRYLVGIGNHDVENCDILKTQIDYDRWDMGGRYFLRKYFLKDKVVRLFFIDTNLYENEYCKGGYDKKEDKTYIKFLIQSQKDWLYKNIRKNEGIKTVNIVIGHIPPICLSHKDNNNRKQQNLLNDLLDIKQYINLYLCADEHNQQYLTYQGLKIFVSGTGGAPLDDAKNPQNNEVGLVSYHYSKGYGFGYITIQKSGKIVIDAYTNENGFRKETL